MQTKLKKGKTFSKPQEKLNRIYEIFTEDMTCAFCDSYLYAEIARVVGYNKYYSSEEKPSSSLKETEP